MKKIIVNARPTPTKQTNASSTIYHRSLSITYGIVDSNNENGTCNVTLVTGFLATNLKIPSKNYPSKDPVIGGIDYPQIGAYVKVLYPEKDLNSGYIEPAELDYTDDNVVDDLPAGTKKLLGGWTQTYDQETGKVTFVNEGFNLTVDPDAEEFSLTDFKGNVIRNNGTILVLNENLEVLQ